MVDSNNTDFYREVKFCVFNGPYGPFFIAPGYKPVLHGTQRFDLYQYGPIALSALYVAIPVISSVTGS
jgi:hypothetical protein